ncbi:MAG: hypothetical protein IT582_02335 [Opitutaceae bacterium]|nr:hypothetical protein [Opitutaceae bacterium]
MNRPLLRITAFLLLALWLPATQHCGLEAAGLFGDAMECHEPDGCATPHEESHCDTDNCQPIENTAYKSSLNAIHVAAPLALTCLCCLHEITPETIVVPLVSPERANPPPELAPTWQFVARAALSPRAPTTVS